MKPAVSVRLDAHVVTSSEGDPWGFEARASSVLRQISIGVRGDVITAQRGARLSASEVGFGGAGAEELAIVASELASNIIKYGVKGTLSFVDLVHPTRGRGLGIGARDCGPQFRDFSAALEDGCDDRGPIAPEARIGRRGLATGLGAVRRFSDGVVCFPFIEGKEIRVVRFLIENRRR
jgi:anti-sigma regulatory factor (Ser/Thr protein kinase)